MTGVDGQPTDPLEAALRALHVQVVSSEVMAKLVVALTDDFLRADLAQLNREALRSHRPWLLFSPAGSVICLGPLFRPGHTGCWECLAQRLRANREAEVYVQRKTGRAEPFAPPRTDSAATRAIACNLAATEIAKWIARGQSSELEGKMLTLDTFTWKTEWHALVRRPQCGACGGDGSSGGPIVLQTRPKTFTRDGGHRTVSPEETLRRYGHHVSRLTGIVPALGRFDCPGNGIVNVYGSGHNFARRQGSLAEIKRGLRSNCGGKGVSDLQARASALCEALERYSGLFRGDEPRIRARLRDLGATAIHPNDCMLYSARQYEEREVWHARQSQWNDVPEPFDESAPAEWTPLWSLTRQAARYLPTAYLWYEYPQDPMTCVACSNGNAAGNTLEEAILQGFFELVERDHLAEFERLQVGQPACALHF